MQVVLFNAAAGPCTPWIPWLCGGHSSHGDRTQSSKSTQEHPLCVQPLAKLTSSCFVFFLIVQVQDQHCPFSPMRVQAGRSFFPWAQSYRLAGQGKGSPMQTEFSASFSALPLHVLAGLCPYTAPWGPRWFPKLAEHLCSHGFSLCCTTPPLYLEVVISS